jgi:hypothetical protein
MLEFSKFRKSDIIGRKVDTHRFDEKNLAKELKKKKKKKKRFDEKNIHHKTSKPTFHVQDLLGIA